MESNNFNNSILRAAGILKCLSDGKDRVIDLSKELNLSRSTVHRLLRSLEKASLVMRDPITRRYYLGVMMWRFASRPIGINQQLIICAFEEMRQLRDLTKETVVLHVRIGLERICIEEMQSVDNIRYTPGKGFVAPLHTGASGKVLLSELPDTELKLMLNKLSFDKVGPNTITDRSVLEMEIQKTRKEGYATSFSERVAGSASISVPVRNYVTPVALGIQGPESRLTLAKMSGFLEEIKGCARRIEKRLKEQGGWAL
jgi:DNA-binding IclR family transcriptional regulator